MGPTDPRSRGGKISRDQLFLLFRQHRVFLSAARFIFFYIAQDDTDAWRT